MRKNKFLAALAIAACLATSVPFSVNAATPGQAKDASKVTYGTVSTANQAIIQKLFDATYYAKENPDLAKAGITTEAALFNHFVKFGIFEGRACCEGFNVAAYKSSYSDLQAAFGDDIVAYYVHYVTFGQTEKRALVTVEAATAAGVTVKSAADGTVVAAGAAKPAAGASSGSAASTENKTAETATETEDEVGEYVATAQNKVGFEVVNSVKTKNTVEAIMQDGIEYDYATGTFYDFTTPVKSLKSDIDKANKYVKGSDGKYHQCQDIGVYLKSGYHKVDANNDDDFWYNKKITDANVLVKAYKTGTKSGKWVEYKGSWYRLAENREQYYKRDASGDAVAWNFKVDDETGDDIYEVHKNGLNWWNVVIREIKGTKGNISATPTAYLRKDEDGKFYSTYHYAGASTDVCDTAEDGLDFPYYVGDKSFDAAKVASLTQTTEGNSKFNYQFFNVKSTSDKFVLKVGASEVTSHKVVSVEDACEINTDYYFELADGKVIRLDSKCSADYCDATYWYANKGYYVDGNHNVYPVYGRDKALEDRTVYVGTIDYDYYTNDAYLQLKTDGHHYHMCYSLDDVALKTDAIKDVPSRKATAGLVWSAADGSFYVAENNVGSIFNMTGYADYEAQQVKGTGRFYFVKK